MKRRAAAAIVLVMVVAVLAWLRDPAWLEGMESGFGRSERASDGIPYRWTAGRSSFFVAADLKAIEIPFRLPMQPGDWPAVVTISIDDRPADRVVLSEDGWETRRILLPPPGSRRLRRIDIHVDRTRPGNRGVMVGAIVREH
jgi:hypothetical protein